MRLEGFIIKPDGKKNKYWHIEVPALDVASQGKSKADAYLMIKDAIEVTADTEGFKIEVIPGEGLSFTVRSDDTRTLVAFMLKRQRVSHELTLQEMAKRLKINSPNAYARYEQGKTAPTVEKLLELLKAIDPKAEPVLRVG